LNCPRDKAAQHGHDPLRERRGDVQVLVPTAFNAVDRQIHQEGVTCGSIKEAALDEDRGAHNLADTDPCPPEGKGWRGNRKGLVRRRRV
jgi:hypothetical protein